MHEKMFMIACSVKMVIVNHMYVWTCIHIYVCIYIYSDPNFGKKYICALKVDLKSIVNI